MAVVIETTLGDITVDLYLEQRPVTCLNFLKLCKMKYYNFNLFHTIRSGFIAQTGDPTGEGSGGESIFGLLEGKEKRFFSGEKMPKIRHTNTGLLSMVCTDDMMVGSQFFFTLGTDLDSLDGIHCVIGEVTEGHEVLRKLNEVICDESHRPYQDVRITHTVILEDPFNDPAGFCAPSRSPSPSAERMRGGRIAPDEELDETQGKSAAEIQEIIEEKEAKARATILEIVGDLPDADIAPPENVLFVCKLNPVTTDEDLEIIFSRFGTIVSCEVIRDKKSGDSLQYAFIEFSDKKSCEDAYFKMDNVLIDDRRIHVDFSQSVSKMRWLGKGRGVQHFDDDEIKNNNLKHKMRSGSEEHTRNRNTNRRHDKEKYKSKRYDEERREHDRHNDRRRERERDYERKEPENNRRRDTEKNYDRKKQQKDYERKNEPEKNRERQREHEKDNDRRKRPENESRQNSHRDRSRSPLLDKTRRKRDDSRERSHKDKRSNNHDNGHNKFYKEQNPIKHDSNSNHKVHENQSNSHTSKHKSPSRNNDQNERSSGRNHEEADTKGDKQRSENRDNSITVSKKRHVEESEQHSKNKRLKKDKKNQKHHEPRTPSPVDSKKKTKTVDKRNSKRTASKKKRRKDSTSSESDSSDSSSSTSDSSSSSEEDRKKRSKKKRKCSTSSSSDTSSSSSSSSSDTSSDTTSSSSSDEKHKKRKRNDKRKVDKKRKKKS